MILILIGLLVLSLYLSVSLSSHVSTLHDYDNAKLCRTFSCFSARYLMIFFSCHRLLLFSLNCSCVSACP